MSWMGSDNSRVCTGAADRHCPLDRTTAVRLVREPLQLSRYSGL